MNGVNKAIIVGTLGRDPEMKYASNGTAIVNLSVATSEKWKKKDTGEVQEKTEWHRVTMFDKLAEVAGQYLKKGSQVYLEGKIQTRKWQDDSGQDRYSTEIIVDGFSGKMQMLGGKQEQAAQQPQPTQPMQQQPAMQQPAPQMQQPQPMAGSQQFANNMGMQMQPQQPMQQQQPAMQPAPISQPNEDDVPF